MKLSFPEINDSVTPFGFSINRTGGHMARSMMLNEITILCKTLPLDATVEKYKSAIIDENVLGKPTFSSRQKSFRHLVELYTLNPSFSLFRIFRKFAEIDILSIPLLGMICAFCRDSQLRYSFGLIDSLPSGEILPREKMEAYLEIGFPNQFSDTMKKSLAQNVNTTWTASGHLLGKGVKKRTYPEPRITATVYAMFSGYLLGLRGETLVKSVFSRLVSQDHLTILSHLSAASARGLLRYRSGGGILEIDFTPMLTPKERELLYGTD